MAPVLQPVGRRLPLVPGPLKAAVSALQVMNLVEGLNYNLPTLSHSPTIPSQAALRSPAAINFPKLSASPTRKSPGGGPEHQHRGLGLHGDSNLIGSETIAIEESPILGTGHLGLGLGGGLGHMDYFEELSPSLLELNQLNLHQSCDALGMPVSNAPSEMALGMGLPSVHVTNESAVYGLGPDGLEYVLEPGYDHECDVDVEMGCEEEYFDEPTLTFEAAQAMNQGAPRHPGLRVLPSPLPNNFNQRRRPLAPTQIIDPSYQLPGRPSSRGLMGPRFVGHGVGPGLGSSGPAVALKGTLSAGMNINDDDDDDWC